MLFLLFFLLYNVNPTTIFEKFDEKCNLDPLNDIVRIDSGKPGPTILFLGGVHGNEKSGAVYLQKFAKDLQEGKINVDSGKIVVIHTANKCGFNNNSRYVPGLEYDDINRNFPKTKDDKCRGPISTTILKEVEKADIVFDFHEGYDFHKINKNSVGSTLTSSGGCKLSEDIAKHIIKILNQNINPINKEDIPVEDREWTHISSNPKSPAYISGFEIKGTLDYYCLIKNKNYILVEITGQNNKQEMDVRLDQIDIIINSFFNYLLTVSYNGKSLKDTINLPCIDSHN